MTELKLWNDRYDSEYPSLVQEVLARSSPDTRIFAQLAHDGYCSLLCQKFLYIWNYKAEDEEMPHAFKLNLPSTGLQYSARNVCIYKQNAKKLPSVLSVSPEGCIRHWSELGKPHKDFNVDLQNEVAHSVVLFEGRDHVHRFIFTTTTSTFFIVEVFHDDFQRAEHLTCRSIDLNTHLGLGRRMSVVLFGNPESDRETVVTVKVLRGELPGGAELMVVFHNCIRFYAVQRPQHLFALQTNELVREGLLRIGKTGPHDNVKHYLLDAVPYDSGILVLVAVNNSTTDSLDLYLGYVSGDLSRKHSFSNFMHLAAPARLRIQAPIHSINLPVVTIHHPFGDEVVVVCSKYVLLVQHPLSEDVAFQLLDESEDQIVGSATVDGLCHVVLKQHGVCALRKLPGDFELSFWKLCKPSLQAIFQDFLGNDFKSLRDAFFTFAAKDLKQANVLQRPLQDITDEQFASLVIQFVLQFLDHEPENDLRWKGKAVFENKKVVGVVSQLKEKTDFYKMFTLFLEYFNLFERLDATCPELGDRLAKPVFLELGEKLVCSTLLFDHITRHDLAVVDNAVHQLAKMFSRQFDHPVSRELTHYDHFFKEVSHFEEFFSEVVKTEAEELEQCVQDYPTRANVINEVGTALDVVINGLYESTELPPHVVNSSNWLNDAKVIKFFDQHVRFALQLLGRDKFDLENIPQHILHQIVRHITTLSTIILSNPKRNKQTSSEIIASLYQVGYTKTAINLATEFQDFDLLIRHSHTALNNEERKQYISDLKERFKNRDFDLVLYDYYRRHGMVEYLLEEKGERLENFLKSHENINWIRNIEKGKYQRACSYLKSMVLECNTASKKATVAGLAKLCALCEDPEDHAEVAEFSEVLKLLEFQKNIEKSVSDKLNPSGRALSASEIIELNIAERSANGFMRALLLVHSLASSPVSPLSKDQVNAFLLKVYSAMIEADQFESYNVAGFEQFEAKATLSFTGVVVNRLYETGLSEKDKQNMLPNVDSLVEQIKLEEPNLDYLKRYLDNEISTLKFCINENMEH